MTRDEILGLEAGNNLDILVAEKVFGWRKGTNEYNILGWQWSKRDGTPVLDDSWDGVWVTPLSCTPNYSTDIKAAWEVVEKMREKSFYVRVNSIGKYFECCFIKNFVNENNTPGSFIGLSNTCKTAPEAICKAALLAVLEEKAEV
jgi:hypothetical protein